MAEIPVPDLLLAMCPWADESDARAMITRADGISSTLADVDTIVPYGSGTTRTNNKGLIVHSSFGSKVRSRDGSSIDISLGLTKEARASTDDLMLRWYPTIGPKLTIEIKVPRQEDPPRPGINEILSLRDGLRALGLHLIDRWGRTDDQEHDVGFRQRMITASLCSLLGHGSGEHQAAFVQIVAPYAGESTEIMVKANGSVYLSLDPATITKISSLVTPCLTLHLVTHPAEGGKTYRAHRGIFSHTLPTEAPDAITTMRLMAELGLSDLPRIIRR